MYQSITLNKGKNARIVSLCFEGDGTDEWPDVKANWKEGYHIRLNELLPHYRVDRSKSNKHKTVHVLINAKGEVSPAHTQIAPDPEEDMEKSESTTPSDNAPIEASISGDFPELDEDAHMDPSHPLV